MPVYMKIGGGFRVGRDGFVGPVVASPYAFFLCVEDEQRRHCGRPRSAAQLGGLIAAAVSGTMAGWKGAVRTGILEKEDIAATYKANHDQPARPFARDNRPRRLAGEHEKSCRVCRAKTGNPSSRLFLLATPFDLHTDEEVFRLDLSIFRRGRATGFLRGMGWEF